MEWDICGLVKMMKSNKNIVNNYYIRFSVLYFILAFISLIVIKCQTQNILYIYPNAIDMVNNINIVIGVFVISVFVIAMIFTYLIRKEIVKFSESIIYNIDAFIDGEKAINFDLNKDNLISKVQNKFKYMIEIMENKNSKYIDEKENIKTLISDISHQIKTPIANISMYNETLINRELGRDKQIQFLNNMQSQVNKLEWLVKSLIKMSRLENGIISLNIKNSRISDTIANALSGVYLKAQRKNIDINIDVDEKIEIYHDKRWTSEAFFNIIENAIKYTNDCGHIKIKVEKMELFTKISVEDSGIGIEEHEINNIFKRFYRSAEVGEIEGVGVGLYLVREIITKQNGYLKVESEKGKGSIFSVYMKN